MTTNQTIDGVPRDRLEDAARAAQIAGYTGLAGELRALLDAPTDRPQAKPVAWHYRVSAGPQTGWSLWHDGKGEEFKKYYQVETRPLYAEQPAPVAPAPINYGALDPVERLAVCRGEVAPVAVVTPERKASDGFGEFSPHSNGWNACLDEVTRLNGSKP